LLFLRPQGFFAEGAGDELSTAGLRDALTPAQNPGTRRRQTLAWILAAMAVFPLFSLVSGLGWQILVRGIGIFILLALGLNILLGLAGVLDLGYAAAFGIGAYAAAVLTNPWGLFIAWLPHPPDFLLVFLFSASTAGLFGLLKGLLTGRLRSDYLALATLALGLLIPRLVVNLKFLTGGAAGISALPAPHILGISFANPSAGYYLVFGVMALTALASTRLVNSRTGRAWLASSDDETAATASGVDIGRYRLLALVISSALAGAAGALYASTFAYVDPDILSFHWTAMLLTMVILGGVGSVPGAMLGAILIIGYDKVFIPWLSALLSQFWPKNLLIGSVPDLRGTSFFNFGIILYLTVLLRARRK
jgi:branched-chain amino acid transport system permease protein